MDRRIALQSFLGVSIAALGVHFGALGWTKWGSAVEMLGVSLVIFGMYDVVVKWWKS